MRRNALLPRIRRSSRFIPAILAILAIGGLTVPALARFQNESKPATLSGVFSVSIDREDVPDGIAGGEVLVGRWDLALDDAGTFSVVRSDVGEVVAGTYEAGQATLTFREWTGIVGCESSGDSDAEARYAWRLADDLLTLTPINDSCVERLILLTTRSLGRFDACEVVAPTVKDPFAMDEPSGTPVVDPRVATGVAAQEDFSEVVQAERAIDDLLRAASGCWATSDPDRFMALHSQGVVGQIAVMGPPDAFTAELQAFMEASLALNRVGEVTLDDATHAWAYVEIILDGDPNPQRMNFVQENGVWRFDSFFLFGPPMPGDPFGIAT